MFKGMEYVYEVYRERSFSKAAKNLFISQPSLSAAVKKIEIELGYDIFDRSTKPIGLTEFGEKYIETVQKILKIESEFDMYLNDISELRAGHISIGGTSLFTSYILPPLISKFSKKFPHIKLDIVETSTSQLEKLLYDGEVDLVIDNYDFDRNTYLRQFFALDNIVLAVPSKFEINKKIEDYEVSFDDILNGNYLDTNVKEIDLNVFNSLPFIFLKEGNDTRNRENKICHEQRFSPNVILELDQQITSYNLTKFGLGISFVSDILIKNVGRNDLVKYYKVDHVDSRRDISFYYKRYSYMKKATKEFLKIAEEKRGCERVER